MWVCQCDCGNIKPIRGASLRNGTATSCGCLTRKNASKKNMNNLIGKRFGYLTVIKDSGLRTNHRIIWECQCDCGKIVNRVGDSLVQGDTISCGHDNISIGEQKIIEILSSNNIKFDQQKTYPDLIGKNNMPLRFDFYLPEYNRLIEFDGIQHYKERTIFSDSLEEIQKRDLIKNNYAISNNIELVRIPYWKINSISLETIIGSKYLIEE